MLPFKVSFNKFNYAFKKKILTYFLIFSFIGTSFCQQQFESSWESLDKRKTPDWFSNAKFGIFIHWGLYSVPGFSNKGTYAEWYWHALNEDPNTSNKNRRDRHFAITKFHNTFYGKDYPYSNFRNNFKAEFFDPDQWARIFKRSGAKYVVLTSKHHDGYCLFPNKESSKSYGMPWNSVDSGPKKDLVGELTNSVRKEGLKMGLYYSIWDWYNPYWSETQQQVLRNEALNENLPKKNFKKIKYSKKEINNSKVALNKYIMNVMMPQLKQIIIDYQPSLLFSDGDWWMGYENWKTLDFLSWAANNAPNKEELVFNDRWGKVRGEHGGYYTTEYGAGFTDGSKPWEENRGIGMSFGINRIENIDDYKTGKELIFMLVDIVSRGGNLLLNIGPRSDGTIPVIMQERLLEIGDWLSINGEGIYNTKQWIKDAQWTDGKIPHFTKSDFHSGFPIYEMTINPKNGNAIKEFWFTLKDKNLYFFSPEWPKDESIIIKDITPTKYTKVKLMGCEKSLPFTDLKDGIEIDISSIKINDLKTNYVYGFKISQIK